MSDYTIYYLEIWQVLSSCLIPTQWIFNQIDVQISSTIRWKPCFNIECNGVATQSGYAKGFNIWWYRHGVNVYIRKLKGIFMWQLRMLEHVGIASSHGYSTQLMALGNLCCKCNDIVNRSSHPHSIWLWMHDIQYITSLF